MIRFNENVRIGGCIGSVVQVTAVSNGGNKPRKGKSQERRAKFVTGFLLPARFYCEIFMPDRLL